MVVYSKLVISGVEQVDIYNYSVTKSVSENNSSSSFDCEIDNFQGINGSEFILGNTVQVYAGSSPILAPQFHWNFNTSGPIIYDTASNTPGSMISGITLGSGFIGSAIIAGPPGYVSIDSSHIGSQINNFTISAWFKPQYINTGSVHPIITSFRALSNNGWGFKVQGSGIRFTTFGIRDYDATAGINVVAGSWQHLAAVKGINDVDFYYNGSYMTTLPNSTSGVANSDDPLLIGVEGTVAVNTYSSGLIDDIRFYREPLGSVNIAGIYNSGLGTESLITSDSLLFTGILEDTNYSGKNLNERIKLSGRDYTARLMDRTVEPEVYTNMEIGSIVRDIVSKYTENIGSTYISGTPVILERMVFNHKPVYDAINQLAKLSDYIFYVDSNQELHFEPKSSISSGYTFDSGNVIKSSFKEQRDTVYNQVWVYGDRYLDGYKETFTAGSPLGGSVFHLLYNPHNTEIIVSGGTIQPGAIEGITSEPATGARYTVNYHDKKITFLSGTNYGNNIPTSGNAVVINYKRSLPIVKVGDDESSKSQYGIRTKVIIDKDIKDPQIAEDLMKKELEDSADPTKQGTLKIQGLYNVVPGHTAIVNLPFNNVDNQTYDILEADYDFNKETNLSENIMSIKVNKKLKDVTDTIKDVILDLKKIQAGDISDSDLITRYQTAGGSIALRQNDYYIYQSPILDSFVLGHPLNGILGILRPDFIGSSSYINWGAGSGNIVSGLGLGSATGSLSVYTIANNGSFNFASGYSISMWINTTDLAQSSAFPRLIDKEGGAPRNGWSINWASGTNPYLQFETWSGGQNVGATGSPVGGWQTGTWYHIVGAFTGSPGSSTLYINGDLIKSSTLNHNPGSNNIAVTIGADASAGTSFWSGLMSDLRIYNVGLTAGEIGSLYEFKDVTRGAVAFYRMREWSGVGSGAIYNGLSGNCIYQPLLGDRRGGSVLLSSGVYF